MSNVSDKSCRENQSTLLRSTTFPENRAVCEMMWKNKVQPDRPQTIHYGAGAMRTGNYDYRHTHSEYVIRIPFPRQQW